MADACGDVSVTAHNMAMQRMIQAGAVPITWQVVMLELQRDWAREKTASGVKEIGKQHGGAMGQAAIYVQSMTPKAIKVNLSLKGQQRHRDMAVVQALQ